ncbi:hypothetical protein [Streptacidiphilus sp. PAMC 29251]
MQDRRALRDKAGLQDRTAGRGSARRRGRALLRSAVDLLKALAFLVAACAALGLCYVGVQAFRTTTGLAGTAGTFTARTCQVALTGADQTPDTTCQGTFVSQDGTLTDPHAATQGIGSLSAGATKQLRREPNGMFDTTSPAEAAGEVALVFASLGGTVFLLANSLAEALQGVLPTRHEGIFDAVSRPVLRLLLLFGVLTGLALLACAAAALVD